MLVKSISESPENCSENSGLGILVVCLRLMEVEKQKKNKSQRMEMHLYRVGVYLSYDLALLGLFFIFWDMILSIFC